MDDGDATVTVVAQRSEGGREGNEHSQSFCQFDAGVSRICKIYYIYIIYETMCLVYLHEIYIYIRNIFP